MKKIFLSNSWRFSVAIHLKMMKIRTGEHSTTVPSALHCRAIRTKNTLRRRLSERSMKLTSTIPSYDSGTQAVWAEYGDSLMDSLIPVPWLSSLHRIKTLEIHE
jgi:hypothetical protein